MVGTKRSRQLLALRVNSIRVHTTARNRPVGRDFTQRDPWRALALSERPFHRRGLVAVPVCQRAGRSTWRSDPARVVEAGVVKGMSLCGMSAGASARGDGGCTTVWPARRGSARRGAGGSSILAGGRDMLSGARDGFRGRVVDAWRLAYGRAFRLGVKELLLVRRDACTLVRVRRDGTCREEGGDRLASPSWSWGRYECMVTGTLPLMLRVWGLWGLGASIGLLCAGLWSMLLLLLSCLRTCRGSWDWHYHLIRVTLFGNAEICLVKV